MWAAMGAPVTGRNGGIDRAGHAKTFAGGGGSREIGDCAVFGYNSGEAGATVAKGTGPVKSKFPNEIGLYDMSGNVYEWCWNVSFSVPDGLVVDYHGPNAGGYRVAYGGAWFFPMECCTVTSKFPMLSTYARTNYIGFRVARR